MNTVVLRIYLYLLQFREDESGQDLVEYALLVALVALAAIGGVTKVASAVTTVFGHVSSSLA
jgi:pilus assembly protein Flp/PilA